MTREEEIENMATYYAELVDKEYDISPLRKRIVKNAYWTGANWADEHPNLESLYHDASEEPQGEYKIVCQDEFEHVWLTDYREDKEHYKNGWKECVECECIVRWAYIDDLLPKGGKK